MFVFLSLLVGISHVAATPDTFSQRIVGGDLTTIDRYPFQAALLYGVTTFSQSGGASILNSRSILTAAHNFGSSENPQNYRIRVGSTFANSGGTVHAISQIIIHPNYITATYDSDIAIVRSATVFTFNNLVQPAAIAGANYNVADNQAVWATGWGITSFPGSPSEQLRHVQIWTINQEICRNRYAELRFSITDNMMCSGVLDVGGKDQCTGDSGGPLIHNGVQVGVCSFGSDCGHPRYPGINVRVSRFTNWIQANA